jgi:hypothetical protein
MEGSPPIMVLTKLPLYEEINGGAHRKPASILGAPSVVRHLSFWDVHPDEESALRGSPDDTDQSSEQDSLPTLPQAVENASQDSPISPPALQDLAPGAAAEESVPLQGLKWRTATWPQRGQRLLALLQGFMYVVPHREIGWRPHKPWKPRSETFDVELTVSRKVEAGTISLDGQSDNNTSPPSTSAYDHQDERRKKYKTYIVALDQRLKDLTDRVNITDSFANLGTPSTEFGRGTADICRIWWCGLRVTIRLEMETEYISLTTIIDLSVAPPPDVPRPRENCVAADDLVTALNELKEAFDASNAAAESEPKSDWNALRLRLQEHVWTGIESDLIDHDGILAANLGYVFADFRGLITAAESAGAGPNKPDRAAKKLRPLFQNPCPGGSVGKSPCHAPLDEWRRDALKRLWPLIKSEQISEEFEFTASGYLGGRAVFVSALGPKPGGPAIGPEDWTPLNYYLHTSTHDDWQLGRLIDRIHNLATLRLAATVRIGALTEAGEIADRVLRLIEDADKALRVALKATSYSSPSKGTAADRYKAIMEPPEAAIRIVEAELAKIAERFPLGITGRLERSQYYIDRFMTGADVFRVKRIEGFQVYKEFISRRMTGIFGYIHLLHQRMNDVWAGMSELNRKYATLKMTAVTCDINNLTAAIKHEDNEIKKIQDFGEIALIGILVPYYLGTLFFHAFEHHLERYKLEYWASVIIVSSGFVVLTLRRFRPAQLVDESSRQYDRKRQTVRVLFIILLGIVLSLILAWGDYPQQNAAADNGAQQRSSVQDSSTELSHRP